MSQQPIPTTTTMSMLNLTSKMATLSRQRTRRSASSVHNTYLTVYSSTTKILQEDNDTTSSSLASNVESLTLNEELGVEGPIVEMVST